MTSVYIHDASSKCSLSSISCHTSDEKFASNSATIYLLKKAVFGIPCVANALWGVLQDLVWDDLYVAATSRAFVFDGMNAQSLAEAASVLASAIHPYFYSLLKVFQSAEGSCVQGGEMSVPSDESASSCGQHVDMYVITQVTSRDLNTKNTHQLPTTVYRAYREEESVDDFLLRNARIIDDYFDNVGDSNDYEWQDEDTMTAPSQCSWVMVPQDPNEDAISTTSHPFQAREESENTIDFECCVVCQELFQEGDRLHILPCQHMFHCGCIDKLISKENSSDKCVIPWCPRCTKAPLEAPPQEEISAKYPGEP